MSIPRTAVVTGGKGGLGTALAAALATAGYAVSAPGRSELDVRDPESVRRYFSAHPLIDLLVNNAGVARDGLAVQMQEETWNHVLEVNLRGAFLCAKAVLPAMLKQRRGHIVMIGSYSGKTGPKGQANYAAAKAALVGLTHSLAKEYGGRNVRVNCVLPGWLQTPMNEGMDEREVLKKHVLGRFNTVGDAARFVVFLDSMENASGQVFQLDSRI